MSVVKISENHILNPDIISQQSRSPFSPVKALEVYQKLKNNSFLTDEIAYKDLGENFSIQYPYDNKDFEIFNNAEYGESGEGFLSEVVESKIEELYKKIFGAKQFYKYKVIPETTKNAVTPQFIELLSNDSYTNRIPIGELIEYIKVPGQRGKFYISTKYIKNNEDPYTVYSNPKLFWYDDNGELQLLETYRNYYKAGRGILSEDQADIVVFFDPTSRVLECHALGSDILECVFDMCSVDYGREK